MSEIRSLLANAQSAELRGERVEAARLLREAATYYRDRQQLRRAAQMLRQARRVEGLPEEEVDESVFGFEAPEDKVLVEQREPKLADPNAEAWCSFCCRPKAEVGPLVGGPTGSFVCSSCVGVSGKLLNVEVPSPHRGDGQGEGPTTWKIASLSHQLPSQRRATQRLTRLRARLTLVIGPTGSGKSAWLATLGDVRILDGSAPMTLSDEPTFIVITAEPPPPALILQGEHGPEPIHDTATLSKSLPHLDRKLIEQIDAVFPFESPSREALRELAHALASSRGLSLPETALTQLTELAHRSGRGAHELTALLARIPTGSYS
ncbi:MAG: ClpX C4-type zinc finger protein [Archangium sp.]